MVISTPDGLTHVINTQARARHAPLCIILNNPKYATVFSHSRRTAYAMSKCSMSVDRKSRHTDRRQVMRYAISSRIHNIQQAPGKEAVHAVNDNCVECNTNEQKFADSQLKSAEEDLRVRFYGLPDDQRRKEDVQMSAGGGSTGRTSAVLVVCSRRRLNEHISTTSCRRFAVRLRPRPRPSRPSRRRSAVLRVRPAAGSASTQRSDDERLGRQRRAVAGRVATTTVIRALTRSAAGHDRNLHTRGMRYHFYYCYGQACFCLHFMSVCHTIERYTPFTR